MILFFTILYYIWTTNPHKWNRIFKDLNPTATLFANSYQKVYNETYPVEYARDLVRAHLHDGAQEQFPYGHRGTVLVEVICEMLKATHGTHLWTKCLECDVTRLTISHEYIYTVEHIDRQVQSVTELIYSGMKIQCTPQHCTTCGGQMDICNSFVKAPKIISVILNTNCKITIDKTMKIMNQNGTTSRIHVF